MEENSMNVQNTLFIENATTGNIKKENTWMDLIGFIIFAIVFILILILVLYLSITSPKIYTGSPGRGITFSF
jgi:TRAP-type mannitol/chloroaromatic compound transport system permease small subunit